MAKITPVQEIKTTKIEIKRPQKAPKSLLLTLVIVLLGIASASFITTKTFDFNGQSLKILKLYRTLFPDPLLSFTAPELLKFDGSDPSLPIYLAINGKVYDVSAGKSYYGPGGSYSFFSGKDAARAYITGCFKTHLTHDLRGLTDAEIGSLKTWVDFYEKSDKYFMVGRVIHEEIASDAPVPEPC